MNSDWIDASLGLTFSLSLFEQYQKNGLLQAELHHVPGIRGRCKGYLHLIEGRVVSCYLDDQQGQRYYVDEALFVQLDDAHGPFEWVLIPQPAPITPYQIDLTTPPMVEVPPISPVPTKLAVLDVGRLVGWTYRQKTMLLIVFDAVDGQRTIEDIKQNVPLPPHVVEEALRVLTTLKVIEISIF